MKSLIKSTIEVRVDTLEDVKAYQNELRDWADQNGYQLASYAWTEKSVKVDGDVEVFFQVKYQIVFDDIKNPRFLCKDIQYIME